MVKIGIVGCGYWGHNLTRNFIETKDCWLYSVADLNKGILDKINKRYPSLKTFSNYEDLIADKDTEAVVVATNNKQHFPVAKAALLANKHVLVEKPLASSVREAEELVHIAKENNRVLMVDHTFLYTGAVKKIKELIEKKEVGDILYYDSVRVNLGLFQKDLNVVWDLAPHDLSIMDYLLDEKAVSVSANGVAHLKEGLEDIAYLSLRFNSKLIAHFHFNWMSPIKVRRALIGGTEKMIVYDDMEPSEKIKVYDRKVKIVISPEDKFTPFYDYRIGDMWAPKVDLSEALGLMCAEFVDSIIHKRQPLSDGESGLRVVRILEAASESIKHNGIEVKL